MLPLKVAFNFSEVEKQSVAVSSTVWRSPKITRKPFKIFFSFDPLAAFLFELDLIMADLLQKSSGHVHLLFFGDGHREGK